MNGLISLSSSFRKGYDFTCQLLCSEQTRNKIKSTLTNLVSTSYNVLSSQQARTALTITLMVLLCAGESFGFQTATKSLKEVITGIQKFLYEDVRFALCVIGFGYGAGGLMFSKDPNTRKQAGYAILAAAFFAFAPGILKFISDQTGTTNPSSN